MKKVLLTIMFVIAAWALHAQVLPVPAMLQKIQSNNTDSIISFFKKQGYMQGQVRKAYSGNVYEFLPNNEKVLKAGIKITYSPTKTFSSLILIFFYEELGNKQLAAFAKAGFKQVHTSKDHSYKSSKFPRIELSYTSPTEDKERRSVFLIIYSY